MKKLSSQWKIQERQYNFPYHYLDLMLEEYRLIRGIEYLSYLKIIRNLLGKISSKDILDFGCGDGRFCYELKNSGAKITGVDLSENAIRFAKAFNPKAIFIAKDITKIQFKKKFDYIVSIETLEHIPPKKIEGVLKKLHKILKKGGRLILSVPSTNVPVAKKHYQHFSNSKLKGILQDYFIIEKSLGHTRKGFKRLFFSYFLQKVAILIIPFRNKTPLVKIFFRMIKKYFEKNLELCDTKNGTRIIVECIKK